MPLEEPTTPDLGVPEQEKAPPAEPAQPSAQPPEPGVPPPPPDVVSRAEYDRAVGQVDTLTGQVQQLLEVVRAGQAVPAAPVQPPEPELTDQQLAEMVESGDSAQVVRAWRLQQQQSERKMARVVQALEERGTTLMRGLASRSAKSDMPYYEQFKDQIDRVVSGMPTDALANPDAYILAHNAVAGNPQNVEKLVQQRVEEELRRRATPAPTQEQPGPPTRGGVLRDPNAIPTPEEIYPELTAEEVQRQLATLGYKDWEDFWNQVKEHEHGH